MPQMREFMALTVEANIRVTVGRQDVWAVPGDVLVDRPGGRRQLFHKLDFDSLIGDEKYEISGDLGFGWVAFKKPT